MSHTKKKALTLLLAFLIIVSPMAGLSMPARSEGAGLLTDLMIIPEVIGFTFDSEVYEYTIDIGSSSVIMFFPTYNGNDATVYIQDITGKTDDIPAPTSADEVKSGFPKTLNNLVSGSIYTVLVTVRPVAGGEDEVYTFTVGKAEEYYLTRFFIRNGNNSVFNSFNPATLTYDITVDNNVDTLDIYAYISETAGSTFTISSDNPTDTALNSGAVYNASQTDLKAKLKSSVNDITTTITVTVSPRADSGKPQREFRFNIVRKAAATIPNAENAFLGELTIVNSATGETVEYDPGFGKAVFEYSAEVGYFTDTIDVSVMPALAHNFAPSLTVKINNQTYTDGTSGLIRERVDSGITYFYRYTLKNVPLPIEGINTITIVVTSSSGQVVNTYELDITRQPYDPDKSGADLDALVLTNDQGESFSLSSPFDTATLSYTAEMQYGTGVYVYAWPTNAEYSKVEVSVGAYSSVLSDNEAYIPYSSLAHNSVISIKVTSTYDPSRSATYTVTLKDTKIPVITGMSVSEIGQTSAKLEFNASEAGTFKYVLRRSSSPGSVTMAALTSSFPAAEDANIKVIDISSLDTNTGYNLYYAMTDAAGNDSTPIQFIFFETVTAPLITGDSVRLYTDGYGQIRFNSSMAGTCYYVVIKGLPTPLTQLPYAKIIEAVSGEYKNGEVFEGYTVLASGSELMNADSNLIEFRYEDSNGLPLAENDTYSYFMAFESSEGLYTLLADYDYTYTPDAPRISGTLDIFKPGGGSLTGADVTPYLSEPITVKYTPDVTIQQGMLFNYLLYVISPTNLQTRIDFYTTDELEYTFPAIGAGYQGYTIKAEVMQVNEEFFSGKLSVGSANALAKLPGPAAPTGIGAQNATGQTSGGVITLRNSDGAVTGLVSGVSYDYSSDNGTSWLQKTADTNGMLIGFAAGSYLIRENISNTGVQEFGASAAVTILLDTQEMPAADGSTISSSVNAENNEWGKITGLTQGTEYQYRKLISSSPDVWGAWETFVSTATEPDITGLRPGEYQLKYKDNGEAVFTQATDITIAPSKPWDNGVITLNGSGGSAVKVAWTAPEDGGAMIEKYIVTIFRDDDSGLEFVDEQILNFTGDPLTDPELEVEFAGLTSNTAYIVQIVARNSVNPDENDDALIMEAGIRLSQSGDGAIFVIYDFGEHSAQNPIYEIVSYGESPKHPPEVIPSEGYSFVGWSIDGETIIDPKSVKVTSNITFRALYRALSEGSHMAYVNGFSDGAFRPDAPITRAETAVIAARIISGGMWITGAFDSTFGDVQAGDWFASYVGYTELLGIINGYEDNSFRPGSNVSREEFAKIICEMAKHMGIISGIQSGAPSFDDADSVSLWARDYIFTAQQNGWMTGFENRAEPQRSITRAEAVKLVNLMLGRVITTESIADATLPNYQDVHSGHWAYLHIIEASVGHDYTIENGREVWNRSD